jgi:RimJ/RimL family protein N-acetyltransferase
MSDRLTTRLETSRLILRVPTLDDLDRWAEMMADPDAARFVGGLLPRTLVWRAIMQMHGAWSLTGVAMFSVIEKARGVWIGRVGPWQPEGWPGPEVGWGLHPDAWGKGYGVEAAAAAMDYAFDVLGWPYVIHCIDLENTRSKALARRLGSTPQGETRMPAPFEHVVSEVWGQSREVWQRNRLMVGETKAGAGASKHRRTSGV